MRSPQLVPVSDVRIHAAVMRRDGDVFAQGIITEFETTELTREIQDNARNFIATVAASHIRMRFEDGIELAFCTDSDYYAVFHHSDTDAHEAVSRCARTALRPRDGVLQRVQCGLAVGHGGSCVFPVPLVADKFWKAAVA